MFHDIWELPEIKNYKVRTYYDIDEIIRIHGAAPYDEDYKIKRTFYKYDLQEYGKWEKIDVTKEEYFENYHLEEEQYVTDLNYWEFKDKFWMDILESDLMHNLIPNGQFYFIKKINELILNSEFESKSKIYLNDVIKGLRTVIDELDFIHSKSETNEIQKFVIQSYISSYIEAIEILISSYELIYPKIIEKFISDNYKETIQENPYPEIFTSYLGFSIFTKLHEIYKKEDKYLANYSFLYLALKSENLTVCSNVKFLEFLESYNIYIDKIDSRQAGKDNKKFPLYTSIRDNLKEAQ